MIAFLSELFFPFRPHLPGCDSPVVSQVLSSTSILRLGLICVCCMYGVHKYTTEIILLYDIILFIDECRIFLPTSRALPPSGKRIQPTSSVTDSRWWESNIQLPPSETWTHPYAGKPAILSYDNPSKRSCRYLSTGKPCEEILPEIATEGGLQHM